MKAPPLLGSPAAIPYVGLAVAGLVVVFLTLSLQGIGNQNGLLLLIGVGTLVVRFFWIPYLYLGALAFFRYEIDRQRAADVFEMTDLLLCAGALLYTASIFRMHGLSQFLGPYDSRLKSAAAKEGSSALPGNPRSAQSLHPLEFAWLVLIIPAIVVFALVLTQALWGFGDNRMLVLIWGFVVGLLTFHMLFNFWKRTRMDPETAQLFLQETLWQATRSEQDQLAGRLSERGFRWRRVGRWLWTMVKILVSVYVIKRLIDMQG